jgi:blocked-early-in-transport protein 1
LEEQNDEHIAGLEARVSALREVSLGIRGAVKESSALLGTMGESMETAGRLVRGTVVTIGNMISGGGSGGHMWKLVGFIFLILFLLWLVVGR